MQNIYLLRYNNYYNRIYKKLNTLDEYLTFKVGEVSGNASFNFNDGVITSQIVNISEANQPDYVIVKDIDTNKLSRWFVIESTRQRKGQYNLQLRRDVVADFSDIILDAPCFIEKATLNYNNNLIFNSESMDFNQIKTKETLLKDKSGTPWLVGYFAANTEEKTNKIPLNINADYYLTAYSHSNWPAANKTYMDQQKTSPYFSFRAFFQLIDSIVTRFYFNNYGNIKADFANDYVGQYSITEPGIKRSDVYNANYYTWYTSNYAALRSKANTEFNIVDINTILKYDNKIIQFSDGYYRCTVTKTNENKSAYISDTTLVNTLNTTTKNAFNTNFGFTPTTSADLNKVFQMYADGVVYSINLELVTADNTGSYEWKIPVGSNSLIDAPYKMFAIPLNPVNIIGNDASGEIITNVTTKDKDITMTIATNIATVLGTGCYDLQLLPYCPITNILTDSEGKLNVTKLKINADYSYINFVKESTSAIVGFMFFLKASSFSGQIELEEKVTITEPKVQIECDMHRLCSPNYNGVFEFNAAKNGGISSFNYTCTYLPYTPYIHVAPDFGRLYAQNFGDTRGLVCGGNFSLAIINDAWINYQIQNKNYANIFDRQIQNMEIKNSVQREQEIWNIASGTIGASGSGYALGGGAGAVLGGGASLLGGVRDYQLNETLRQEGINYTKDLFGYNLGNIKALPNSLAKSTSYNIDNKYFPFIEYYTCSEVEKDALRNKIKYNGMTVMTIGTIREYLQPTASYIKGQIIRLENLDEDFHLATEIYNEINKGIYI